MFNFTYRKASIFIAFVVVLFLAYGMWSFIFASDPFVPAEFTQANNESAIIAFEIVEFSAQSSENLSKINELDKQGRQDEAIKLVAQEIKRNEELNKKAHELSDQIKGMANVLPTIKPQVAASKALEALNYEATMVFYLFNYSNSLNDLLLALDDKLNGRGQFSAGRVVELIEKINSEARTINELNNKYNDSVKEFEELLNK